MTDPTSIQPVEIDACSHATAMSACVGGVILRWGARTEVGKVRSGNEDAVLAAPGIYAVADGMGGHEAGEVASRIAVAELERLARWTADDPLVPITTLPGVLDRINTLIRGWGSTTGRRPIGTTVVGVVIGLTESGDVAPVVFHIGDSRCYASIDGSLSLLTTDHSEVQELVDAGRITPDEAYQHPARNVITRSLGLEQHVSADYRQLAPDAVRLLLCSDGLTNALSADQLARSLAADRPAEAVARELVALAMSGDARDNISAVVVDVETQSRVVAENWGTP